MDDVQLNETKKEFKGQYTLIVFPFTKLLSKRPEAIGEELGMELLSQGKNVIVDFNVIKGFLNLELHVSFWKEALIEASTFIRTEPKPINETVLVEYSSPNTNKPLHLGHVRNILLGWSTSKLFEAKGYKILRTKIVNNRGIAICKSMLSWNLFGKRATPESEGIKGDHFVGKWYVEFEKRFKEEYAEWCQNDQAQALFNSRKNKIQSEQEFFKDYKNDYFNSYSELGRQAKELLLKWEASDPSTIALWEMMNSWVYAGFNQTYSKLGVDFDSIYYESDTYLLGKDMIEEGLAKGSFYKESDNSVWVDLTDVGLDKKILLRSDGTSVYITQDIGTAHVRYLDTQANKMIYVVADEQDYHFQVLFEILKKLKEPYSNGLHHLSYGMVELPSGKMKSREGTVVDADDLIDEVINEARSSAQERGELMDLCDAEREEIYRKIALGALKYFILKVNAKKRMVFDPKESVDLQGQTGPYIQNAYVRIKSVLRKWDGEIETHKAYTLLENAEIELIISLIGFSNELDQAVESYDPSGIANFAYELAKKYHRFYHDVRILTAESESAKAFRLNLSSVVADCLLKSMNLLGIEMPERM